MQGLLKALRRPGRSRWLMAEAVLQLYLARLAIKLLPYRWLTWYFLRPVPGPPLGGAARKETRAQVVWAVHISAHDLPGEFHCFPKAIAAQAMLRRRRVATALYYGAATLPGQGLAGHVWLQDGPDVLLGHFRPGRYKVLAAYPAKLASIKSSIIT
jgi:hypothetical protein